MKTNTLKAFAGFALVLMVLGIVPSGAFATEDTTVAEDTDTVRNGKMMGNMGAAKDIDGMDKMQKMPGNSQMSEGQGLALLEDLNDENFAEVQASILERLVNQTERLTEMKARCLENENEEKSEEFEARVVEIVAFQAEVDGASNAEDLKVIIFDHVKENSLWSLEGQIEKLGEITAELEESGDANKIAKLGEQTSELQVRYEAINGAEDLDALNEVKFSFAKEETLNKLNGQISRLEEKLENFDEDDNCFLSEEKIEARITELEELKETVNSAESQEDLREIRETFSLGGNSQMEGRGSMEGRGQEGRDQMECRGQKDIPVEDE